MTNEPTTGQHGSTRADYLAVLRIPGVRLPAMASLVARLPIAMGSISLLIYIQRTTGTFGEAGLVGGAALLGLAFGSVIQGKLIDRFGPTRTLALVTAVFALVTVANFAAIESHAPLPTLIAAALVFGFTQPAVAGASRGIWGRVAPAGRMREAAYTYEAISLEIFFVLGPGIAGILAAQPWAGTGLLVTALLFVVGTILFICTATVRQWRPDGSTDIASRGMFAVVKIPGVQTLVFLVLGLGMIIGFSEVAIPAAATEAGRPELSGILLGIWSLAGVLFGIVYAARPWPRRLHLRAPALLGGFAVLVGLMAIAPGLLGLAIALVISGTLITPQSTTHSLIVERVAPPRASAEAYGWVITGVTLGVGIGQAVSGQVVVAAGPSVAMAAGIVPGLVMALIVWLRRDTIAPPRAIV